MVAASREVTALVCAYTLDRWDDLQRSIASLVAQEPPLSEIIVVIDHNPELLDRATEILAGCRILPSVGEPGLSGARNTGLAAATSEIVAFLDDDAVALPGWHAGLAGVFADEAVLAAGGPALPRWVAPPPEWFPPTFLWVVGCTYEGHPSGAGPVRNVLGCSMAFRRAPLESIGGFRNELGRKAGLPFGAEETETCIRLSQRWPASVIVNVPEAVVHHTVPPSRVTWTYFRRRCFAEGMSKAVLARFVGRSLALETERHYTRSVLPRAALAALREAVRRRRPGLVLRAGAIGVGLLVTAAGYGWGTLGRRLSVASR
jgi:glycosyltransferase involved in cell wall biosynthesis